MIESTRAVTQDEQDNLLEKQFQARVYFNESVFRKARNMRIRAFFKHSAQRLSL